MLITRTLQFSKLLLKISSPLIVKPTNLPLLKYQRFFKEVQKASRPQQAIDIYDSYVKDQGGDYHKYLTITMRILTRLLRQLDEKQMSVIDNFLDGALNNINQLDVPKLQSANLKDVILFFYKYSQYVSSLKPQQRNIVERFLKEFVTRFEKAKDKIKVITAPILFTTIRLSSMYCPSLEKQIINNSISVLYSQQDTLISNTLTFINLLSTIRQIYDPAKPFHQELIHSTFFLLSMKDINKLFDSYAKATILHTIIDIRQMRGPYSIASTNLLLQELQKTVEAMLLQQMWQSDQRTLDYMISGLVKLKAESIILKEYYNIIEQSIEPGGMAKVNPNLILWAVSLLDRKNMPELLTKSWQQRLVKMLRVYYKRGNNFVYPISSQLLMLLKKEMFDHQTNLQLYYFFFNEYHFYKKENLIKTLYMYIKQTQVHAIFKNKKGVMEIIGYIEEMLKIIVKNWGGKYQDYFWSYKDLQVKVEQAQGIEYPQVRQVEFDPRMKGGFADKVTYYSQIKAYLLCMQLKISQNFGLPQQIENIICKLSMNNSSQQLLLFLNYVIFRTKLSQRNYKILQDGLDKIFKDNQLNLRENIYQMVIKEIYQQDSCQANISLKKQIDHLRLQSYQGNLLCYQQLQLHLEKTLKHPLIVNHQGSC